MRTINNSLAFTSMGIEDKSIPGGSGPPLFRIQGKLVHRIGKLIPDEEYDAKCGQMWFYSSDDQYFTPYSIISQ